MARTNVAEIARQLKQDIYGPEWPVLQQAAPTVIKAEKNKSKPAKSDVKVAVLLPDPQIGFRKYEDGTLDPFHDEIAINTALAIMAYLEDSYGVSQVVNLGDFLDLSQQGRFIQEAYFQQTTQPSIDYGHLFLAKQRATCPDAKIVLVEGNHDARFSKFVLVNAAAAYGLRRANIPGAWPVLSVPYLLRCDELDVEYIDAYPAGEWWINTRLRAIHGNKVRSSGSTANALVKDNPHISTVFGHVHRLESHYKSTHDRSGPIRSVAASPGCLCRVDGAVPSFGSGVGTDGKPATHWEDWQQGMGVVWYREDGRFSLDMIHIIDGVALYHGREFRA